MRQIILFFFTISTLVVFGQRDDSSYFKKKIDETLTIFQKNYNDSNSLFYRKILNHIKADSLFFLDSKGNFSNKRFYALVSQLILDEQVDVMKDMAKITLSKSEYKKFLKLKHVVGYSTKVSAPIVTYQNSVYYDNSSVWDIMVRNLIDSKNLNSYERLYYLTALQISNDVAPDFLGDLFNFRNSEQAVAMFMQQAMIMFFVTMHEFFHAEYDNVKLPIIEREINADSFAISQCVKIFDQNSEQSGRSIESLIKDIFGEDYLAKIQSANGICSYEDLVNAFVKENEFAAMFVGVRALELIAEREVLTFIVSPDNLKILLKRINNQYKTAQALAKCSIDNKNIFCCIITNNIASNSDLLNQFENAFSIRDLGIDKAVFERINSSDPSLVSFQLGYYNWVTENKAKAIEYFNSSNLFVKDTPYRLLCNLLLCDIYLVDSKLFDKQKALLHFEISKKINNNLELLGNKIFEKYSETFKN